VSSPAQLLDALGKAVGEGRIARGVHRLPTALLEENSAGTRVQMILRRMPGSSHNLGGNKLYYYLKRSIESRPMLVMGNEEVDRHYRLTNTALMTVAGLRRGFARTSRASVHRAEPAPACPQFYFWRRRMRN